MTGNSRAYDVTTVERRWRLAWHEHDCFKAEPGPASERFFNYDSGPFPNGELHLGHVRTYVLGDLTARYQRLRGKCVLYCTEWDSFGLPNELAALEAGVSPREYTQACVQTMKSQLIRLGISYDWDHVTDTSEPEYYRWTQWLFLEMLEAGLIERCEAEQAWCPSCETTLARVQVVDDACWRCDSKVQVRSLEQWSIKLSRFSRPLLHSMAELDQWSQRSKNLLRGFIAGAEEEREQVRDWVVSRQRAWGTPIPVVYCDGCGAVPVPRDSLPVQLPADLDWTEGPRALAKCAAFVDTKCPQCNGDARRETDTLDCYFDDIWCQLAGAANLGPGFAFHRDEFATWLPVDHFHSGYDTFFYLHLHRFLGLFLAERGLLESPEPIRSYRGHDMVLAGGRKMSKHLGNTLLVGGLLDEHGADAVRVAILWAANPERPVHFDDALLCKASTLLDRIYALSASASGKVDPTSAAGRHVGSTRAARRLRRQSDADLMQIRRLIERYRPCAALEVLSRLLVVTASYAHSRLEEGQLSAEDRASLGGVLRDLLIAASPFAPHLAEECWSLLGGQRFIGQARWPES